MKDYLSIGSVPSEENCAQVGQNDYSNQANIECRAFANQLARQFGKPPGNAVLVKKSNPHDFGCYYEINVRFNDESEEETDYAFKLENEMPAKWDREAITELRLANYFLMGEIDYR